MLYPQTTRKKMIDRKNRNRKVRRYGSLFFILVMIISLGSCNQGTGNSDRTVTSGDVKDELEEAGDTARAYMNQEKQLLVNIYEERLELIEQQIAGMKDRMASVSASAEDTYQSRIDALEDQYHSVEKNLKDFQKSSKDAWEELLKGVDEAVKELEESVSQAKDEFEQ